MVDFFGLFHCLVVHTVTTLHHLGGINPLKIDCPNPQMHTDTNTEIECDDNLESEYESS